MKREYENGDEWVEKRSGSADALPQRYRIAGGAPVRSPAPWLARSQALGHLLIGQPRFIDRPPLNQARGRGGDDDRGDHRRGEGAGLAGQFHHQHQRRDRSLGGRRQHRARAEKRVKADVASRMNQKPELAQRSARERAGGERGREQASGRAARDRGDRRDWPNEHQRREDDRLERMQEQELGDVLPIAEELREDDRDQSNDPEDKRRRNKLSQSEGRTR